MKFISKASNYCVVLRQGIPGERLTGRQAVPGLYVRFQDGATIVNDENICKMLRENSAFNVDYIESEENVVDPYAASRRPSEPEHNVMEIQYGHVGKNINPRPLVQFTPEQKQVIQDMATAMAKEMAPTMAKEMLKEVFVRKQELDKETSFKETSFKEQEQTTQTADKEKIIKSAVKGIKKTQESEAEAKATAAVGV